METYLAKTNRQISGNNQIVQPPPNETDGDWSESMWSLSQHEDSDRSFGENKEEVNSHSSSNSPVKMSKNSNSSQQQKYSGTSDVTAAITHPIMSIKDTDSSTFVNLRGIEVRRRNSENVRSWGQPERFDHHQTNPPELPPHQPSSTGAKKKMDEIRKIRSFGQYSRGSEDVEKLLSSESLRNKPPRPPTVELGVQSGRVVEMAHRVEGSPLKSEQKEPISWKRSLRLSRTCSPDCYACKMSEPLISSNQSSSSPSPPCGAGFTMLKHSLSAGESDFGRAHRRLVDRRKLEGDGQENVQLRRVLTHPFDAYWPSEASRKRTEWAKTCYEEHRRSPVWVGGTLVYPRAKTLSIEEKGPRLKRSPGIRIKRDLSLNSAYATIPNLAPIVNNNNITDPVAIRSSQTDYQSSLSSTYCTPSPPNIAEFSEQEQIQLPGDRWPTPHSNCPSSVGLYDLLKFCQLSNVSMAKLATVGLTTSDPIIDHGFKVIPVRLSLPWTKVAIQNSSLTTNLKHTKGAFKPVIPKVLSSYEPVVLLVEDVVQGSPFTQGQLLVELDRVSLISVQSRDINAQLSLLANTLIRAYEDDTVNELCFSVATPDASITRLIDGCLEVLEEHPTKKFEQIVPIRKKERSRIDRGNDTSSLPSHLSPQYTPTPYCLSSNRYDIFSQ